jgi:hypothetical protein
VLNGRQRVFGFRAESQSKLRANTYKYGSIPDCHPERFHFNITHRLLGVLLPTTPKE